MTNHYHLLLQQIAPTGITEFMRKIGTGYTMYFNQKYQRVGPLFQGRFKGTLIKNQNHLLFLPHYIHLNPLDLILPSWREGRVKKEEIIVALEFLKKYRWSSYLDYIGQNNFPSITQRDIIMKMYGDNPNSYRQELIEWLKSATQQRDTTAYEYTHI